MSLTISAGIAKTYKYAIHTGEKRVCIAREVLMKVYDVLVVGGGSAGVFAALSSARNGAKTLLIEERAVLGGTNTTALVGPLVPFIGENNRPIVGGIPQELISNLIKKGGSLGHLPDPIDFAYTMTPVDFKMMQLELSRMVQQEPNLEVVLHSSVIDVVVENRTLKKVMTRNPFGDICSYEAKTFIDATGDADVSALAGVEFKVGRESDGKSQPMTMCFNVGGVDLDCVRDDVASNPDNFVISEAIKNGERMGYVAISGYFKEVKESNNFPIKRDRLLFFQGVREDEVGVNTTRILNKSSLNPQELIEAELEGQTQVLSLFEWLKDNIPAFKNSYIKDVGSIGVRESRHLVGRKTLTELDVLKGNTQEKSIAVGAYPIDLHSPDSSLMEFLEENIVKNFEIDLEMLMPKNIDNLLVVGRPISATHQAHAASRVSATCMAIGQSAGIVCALSSKENKLIQDLEYNTIKNKIETMGGIVTR